MLRWSCANASRVVGAYVLQAQAAPPAGPWLTINGAPFPADVACAFVHVGAQQDAQLGTTLYRVAAVDYWGRSGAWSATATLAAWPTFGSSARGGFARRNRGA